MRFIIATLLFFGMQQATFAQTGDPTPREYQFFKANVPVNFEDSFTTNFIYLQPQASAYTKEFRPIVSLSMRTTDFEIGNEERQLFTKQLIKEYSGKKGKLINQNLQNDKAEFWIEQKEKNISYVYKYVVKFDSKKFVIISYKDLNKQTVFQADVQLIFDSIEFK